MWIHIPATGLYTYSDGFVVYGAQFTDEIGDTLVNPAVIFEVLSDSTEGYATSMPVGSGPLCRRYRARASCSCSAPRASSTPIDRKRSSWNGTNPCGDCASSLHKSRW